MTDLKQLVRILKGGPGSGNFGHAGIPGQRGGSASEGGGSDKPKKIPARITQLGLRGTTSKEDYALDDLELDSGGGARPRTGTKNVRLRSLIATQDKLVASEVQRYIDDPKSSPDEGGVGTGRPLAIQMKGKLYLTDGHHRVAAAIMRGDKTIKVSVIKPRQRKR